MKDDGRILREIVFEVITKSAGRDWIFVADCKVFFFLPNLLIRLEPQSDDAAADYDLFYENTPIAALTISGIESGAAYEERFCVMLRGPLRIELNDIRVFQNLESLEFLVQDCALTDSDDE